MATYEDIKAEALRIHREPSTPDATRHLALVVIALCERLAELEQRHQVDIHRIETWFKNVRR